MDPKAHGERLLKFRQIKHKVPASRTTLWRWEQAGLFPKRRQVGGGVAWLESEVDAWIAARKAVGGGK